MYIAIGGIPPRQGRTPLGHEPAGEVIEVGSEVDGITVGDHVVVNPMAAPSGIIGNGGATGALADYLLDRERGGRHEPRDHPEGHSVRGRRTQRADGRRPARRQPHRARTDRQGGGLRSGPDRSRRDPGLQVAGCQQRRGGRPHRNRGWTRRWRSAPTPSSTRPTRTSHSDCIELHGEGEALFPGRVGTDIYLRRGGRAVRHRHGHRQREKGRDPGHRRRSTRSRWPST